MANGSSVLPLTMIHKRLDARIDRFCRWLTVEFSQVADDDSQGWGELIRVGEVEFIILDDHVERLDVIP